MELSKQRISQGQRKVQQGETRSSYSLLDLRQPFPLPTVMNIVSPLSYSPYGVDERPVLTKRTI